MRCTSCCSQHHDVKVCPLLHFIPDCEKVIKSFEFYNEQPRKPFARKRKRKNFSQKNIIQNAEQVQKRQKIEKENLRMSKLKKRQNGMNMDYDTLFFGSEMSLSSSESCEDGEQSQLEESQTEEKEVMKVMYIDGVLSSYEGHGNGTYVNANSLLSNFDNEKTPKTEEDRKASVPLPDLLCSFIHPPIPPSIPPSLALQQPSSPHHHQMSFNTSSFSSQQIINRKNNVPVLSSSTNIGLRSGGRKEDGGGKMDGGGRKEEGKKEEESGTLRRRGKRMESDKCMSIGSRVGTGGTEKIRGRVELDRVSSFKNYFPESNVKIILEIYEKKRKLLAFLHEAKLQSVHPNTSGHRTSQGMSPWLRNTNFFPASPLDDSSTRVENNEQIRRRLSKYTFYVSRMFEIMAQKKKKTREDRKHEEFNKKARISKVFSVKNFKRKTFFDKVGESKKLSEFVLEIMHDPRYEEWKRNKTLERRSFSIFRKKAKK